MPNPSKGPKLQEACMGGTEGRTAGIAIAWFRQESKRPKAAARRALDICHTIGGEMDSY